MISVTDVCLDKEFSTLRAHEIAKKITAFEILYLVHDAWNVVSEITIQNCFRHGEFIFSSKEVPKSYPKKMKVGGDIQS